MKIPSRSFALAGGLLVCEPRTKTPNVVQSHLVKHPVGVTSLSRGGAWGDEGWGALGVIDEASRAALIAQILRLRDGIEECSVPELRGAPASAPAGTIACDTCPASLAKACAELTAPTLGARYFAVLEAVLAAVSSPTAARVSKGTLISKLFARLRSLDGLEDLVVGYAGLDARNKRSIIVRLSRGDGVRAELYFEEPDQLSWRTLYRDPKTVSTPNGCLQFLLDAPPQANSTMALSEICLVSRLFWEKA
jgi:hypothetical protein